MIFYFIHTMPPKGELERVSGKKKIATASKIAGGTGTGLILNLNS